jgi:hypothetical protein
MNLHDSVGAVYNSAFNLEDTETTVRLPDGTEVKATLTRDSARAIARKLARELIKMDRILRRQEFDAENDRIHNALCDKFNLKGD